MPDVTHRRNNERMDDWLTPETAAAILGVTRTHLHVIAHRQAWRRIRVGQQTAYAATDVYTTAEHRSQRASTCLTSM